MYVGASSGELYSQLECEFIHYYIIGIIMAHDYNLNAIKMSLGYTFKNQLHINMLFFVVNMNL